MQVSSSTEAIRLVRAFLVISINSSLFARPCKLADALQHFPDIVHSIGEMSRVLKEGGMLFISGRVNNLLFRKNKPMSPAFQIVERDYDHSGN